MIVSDLFHFGKGLARVAVYIGLFLFVVSTAFILVSIGDSIIQIYVNAITGVGTAFNQGSMPECLGNFMHLLGLDVFITSALSSVIGLGLIWSGFVIQITILSYAFSVKKLLAEAIQ